MRPKINIFGSDEKQWIWKKKGARLIQKKMQRMIRFGGGNIMV